MKRFQYFGWLVLAVGLASSTLPALAGEKILFQTNFSAVSVGELPENFLVLSGEFAVREGDGQKYLELPGAPLDSFGTLFGPTFNPKNDSHISVQARIYGEGRGRRFPTFAIGLCGVGGYRLQISPAKKAIELYQNEQQVATQPFEWKSGTWTHLRLQIRKEGGRFQLEGRAWPDGSAEPATWLISYTEPQEPVPGRSSIWGSPFSGTPIRYDDLVVIGDVP